MAKKPLSGINGVLGELISAPAPSSQAQEGSPARSESSTSTGPAGSQDPGPTGPRQNARLGRPPGRSSAAQSPKEKTTLRISARLMAEYRDWSWDARCQLGELVERALLDYRDRCREDR